MPVENPDTAGPRRLPWQRILAAGVVALLAAGLVLFPLVRTLRTRDQASGAGSPQDPVARLSSGPREFSSVEDIRTEYQSALTSYSAFLVRADDDIAFLERFCGGEPVNPEEGMQRAKSMARFFEAAHVHEIDMTEIRRVAGLQGIDLDRPPWETRQAEVKELNLRLVRAQDACRERNRQRAHMQPADSASGAVP